MCAEEFHCLVLACSFDWCLINWIKYWILNLSIYLIRLFTKVLHVYNHMQTGQHPQKTHIIWSTGVFWLMLTAFSKVFMKIKKSLLGKVIWKIFLFISTRFILFIFHFKQFLKQHCLSHCTHKLACLSKPVFLWLHFTLITVTLQKTWDALNWITCFVCFCASYYKSVLEQ